MSYVGANASGLSKLSMYACLFIAFAIPLTLGQGAEDSQVGNLYYWTRLIMVPLAIAALFWVRRRKILYVEYAVLAIIALLIYLIHEEIPSTCILLLVALIVFDSIDRDSISRLTSTRIFKIVFLIFVLQIVFFTYQSYSNTHSLSVMTSAQDRNYSAFFILLMYFLIPSREDGKLFHPKDVLLILAVLTFSRTGMIAAMVILAYNILFRDRTSQKILFISRNAMLVFVLVFGAWMLVCVLFCGYFNFNNYVYEYRTGFERFTFESFFDYSNYIRAYANVAAVSNAGPVELFFGYSDEAWENIVYFDGKAIFPHNLVLAIFVKGGILYSFAVIRRAISIFKNSENTVCLYVVFLIFSNFLGPSLYYGVDLILFLLASASLKSRAESVYEIDYNGSFYRLKRSYVTSHKNR